MSHPGIRIKELRTKQGLSQEQLAEKLDMNRVNISNYERGVITNIPGDVLVKLADILDTNTDYLLGRSDSEEGSSDWDSQLPELNDKDDKDIAKDLEKIIQNLSANDGYSHFGGQTIEELDEEDKELLISSLENSIRLAKRMAKQKFTPKKYRK